MAFPIPFVPAVTVPGTAGNDVLVSFNSALITGNAGNDVLVGSDASDQITGDAGNDTIAGQGGDDLLDGGAGDDVVTGGEGDDTLLYVLSENAGGMDVYVGGAGTDTLLLVGDFLSYVSALSQNTLQELRDNADDILYPTLTQIGLTATGFEKFGFKLGDQILDIVDDPVIANDDAVTYQAGSGLKIFDILANDSVPDLVKSIEIVTPPALGNLGFGGVITPDNQPIFTALFAGGDAFLGLDEGETATQTAVLKIIDADGDSDTSTLTITVTGVNDASVISGDTTGTVREDGDLTATGDLDAVDPDDIDTDPEAEEPFVAGTQTGTYGSLSLKADGSWTYTLDNASDAVQALPGGASETDSFTVATEDGSTETITVTVRGRNDAAVIGGDLAPTIGEEDPSFRGVLVADDVDAGESLFQRSAQVGTYGTLTLRRDGTYDYDLDNAKVQFLGAGDLATDTFTVKSADGTEATITIDIQGENDVAVLGGDTTGAVAEDGEQNATGTLTIADVDDGEALFQATTRTVALGTFALAEDGSWSFTLDNAAAQALKGDAVETLVFDALTSADGSASTSVTITVTGEEDGLVVGGDLTGEVIEDVSPTVTGQLTAEDADDEIVGGFAPAVLVGAFGTLTLEANGAWSYTLDAAAQALKGGEVVTDSFEVSAIGGEPMNLVVTVTGTNDAAVIGGDLSASATEDDAAPLTGTLTVSDVDAGEAGFVPQVLVEDGFTFTLNADGTYGFEYDPAQLQFLKAGEAVSEGFTVKTVDGTTATLTATITGRDDAAVIGGDLNPTATEDDPSPLTGTLTVTDPDAGEAAFKAQSVTETGFSFTLNADGTYSFSYDPAQLQVLPAGQSVFRSFPVESLDGTKASIQASITGVNDAAVIGGDLNPTLSEDDAAPLTGTLTVSDVDVGEASFKAQDVVGEGFTFTLGTDGKYSIGYDEADVQYLAEGETVSRSFAVESFDGTKAVITATATGVNDAPVIAGDAKGSVTEDAVLTASGTLTISDADLNQSRFVAGTQTRPEGSFTIGEDGAWSFALNNADAGVQGLDAGQTQDVSFSVETADGTEQVVTITVNGADEDEEPETTPAELSGDFRGRVREDRSLTTSGVITVTDPDEGEAGLQAETVGTEYGTFTVAENGTWSFELDNAAPAVQSLADKATVPLTFPVTSLDGEATRDVTITVVGSNDRATIDGDRRGIVVEDLILGATGKLFVSDVDSGEAGLKAGTVSGKFGSFTIEADGDWSYLLNNDAANVQKLGSTQERLDQITVESLDGSASAVLRVFVLGQDEPTLIG